MLHRFGQAPQEPGLGGPTGAAVPLTVMLANPLLAEPECNSWVGARTPLPPHFLCCATRSCARPAPQPQPLRTTPRPPLSPALPSLFPCPQSHRYPPTPNFS